MASNSHRYILVTGANSGLGLGICTRLIDDFLNTQPATDSLTILFTTRSARKGSDTLGFLKTHLAKSVVQNASHRVNFQPENLELTNLLSVRELSQKLLASDLPYLNAIVLNAGIGGWSGLNWPVAFYTYLTQIRQATTWPTYKKGVVGLVAKPQLPPLADGQKMEEPPLGEVFGANVFGHYMLAHSLMPLLWACNDDHPAKIIWVSSIEPGSRHYIVEDPHALRSTGAYEHSKRLTDLLALSADGHLATNKSVSAFFNTETPSKQIQSRPKRNRPSMQVVHPGVCITMIVDLYWIMYQASILSIYIARLCGNPWASCSVYTAALSATWMALISPTELKAKEAGEGGGKAKWGSSSTRWGHATVRRTDVDKYGLGGSGNPFKDTWWAGSLGRITGAVDATKEDVERFVTDAAGAWKVMEELRVDWEERLERYDELQRNAKS